MGRGEKMKHFSFTLNYILLPLQIFQLVSYVWEYYRGGIFFWVESTICMIYEVSYFPFFLEDNMSKAFIIFFFFLYFEY